MSESIQELTAAIRDLTQRVGTIEAKLGIARQGALPQAEPTRAIVEHVESSHAAPPIAKKESFGGKFLGGVAVLCFVVAAGYFLRLAIESGWLNPLRQVVLSSVFGFLLIFVGQRFHRSDKGYGALLAAGGCTVLYLTTLFAHFGYYLLSPESCMAVVLAISILSLYLFSVFKHSFFIVAAIVGGYCAPQLLPRDFYGQTFSLSYLLILDVLFCILAIKAEIRRIIPIAAYFALFVTQLTSGWWVAHAFSSSTLVIFNTIQFLIFSAATFWYSVELRSPLSRVESWFLAPIPVIFYFMQHERLETLAPQYVGFLGLIFGILIILAEVQAGRRLAVLLPASFGTLGGAATVIIVHSLYSDLLAGAWEPFVSILILLAVPWLSKILKPVPDAWVIWVVLLMVVVGDYQALVNNQPASAGPLGLALYSALFGSLLIYGGLNCDKQRHDGLVRGIILAAGAYQLVLMCNRIALHYFAEVTVLSSALSAAVALGLMLLAYSKIDRILAKVALFLFAITAYKFLFDDLANAAGTVRIMALLFVGALLYAGGFLLRKLESRE